MNENDEPGYTRCNSSAQHISHDGLQGEYDFGDLQNAKQEHGRYANLVLRRHLQTPNKRKRNDEDDYVDEHVRNR